MTLTQVRSRSSIKWTMLALAVIGALAVGLAFATPGAAAVFHATRNIANNALRTAAVGAPSQLRAFRIFTLVILTWTARTNGDGYQILRAQSSTSACAGVTWQPIAHVTGINTTVYIDRNAPRQTGKWYCYQVRTTLSTWTSQTKNPTTAVQ